jgi:hypothetical protein
MPVLARKITRAKWQQKTDLADGEIAADAVTVDLRTTGNTLSFWRCSSADTGDLQQAVLALAAAADRADKFDVAYLDEQAVVGLGLATKNTPGDTPVLSLREQHVDVQKLDLVRLGGVATMVAYAHRSNAVLTMTKKEIIDLVAQGVRKNLVSLDALKGEMKVKVEAKFKDEA